MEYILRPHRQIDGLFYTDNRTKELWDELVDVIKNISEEDIITTFNQQNRKGKSISEAINKLLDERLIARNWNRQSPIFKDPVYKNRRKSTWTLDFTKETVALEVAFNHGGNIAWNLIKPVLSSELNHVEKEIQTKVGIVISATADMIQKGGFDGAVGSFEKFAEYLKPLNNLLVTPLMLVGLKAPKTFRVEHTITNGKKVGTIVEY